MGAYAFEADPPFRITRSTTMPLMYGSKHNRRILEFPLVIFPGGSTFDEEAQEHFVVFGVNDFQSGWVKIPHKDLLALMRNYVQVEENKSQDPSVSETDGRIHPIKPVAEVTGDDFGDKEVAEDTGDDGYPGSPEKRVAPKGNKSSAKRAKRSNRKKGKPGGRV